MTATALSASDRPERVTDRLRSSRVIQGVLRRGRRAAGSTVVVHVRATDGEHREPTARVAVVASRKVGSAVQRNRAKRLLREAARRAPWRQRLDVVLVARRPCAASDLATVTAEVSRLAGRLGATTSQSPAGPGT